MGVPPDHAGRRANALAIQRLPGKNMKQAWRHILRACSLCVYVAERVKVGRRAARMLKSAGQHVPEHEHEDDKPQQMARARAHRDALPEAIRRAGVLRAR